MMRVCFLIDELPWLIRLEQHETEDLFCVTYGFQVDDGLTYSEAASKLGQALMHRAACDGMLESFDDETPYGDELCRNGVALADCDCC
jgi:hypothetical protein